MDAREVDAKLAVLPGRGPVRIAEAEGRLLEQTLPIGAHNAAEVAVPGEGQDSKRRLIRSLRSRRFTLGGQWNVSGRKRPLDGGRKQTKRSEGRLSKSKRRLEL